MVCCTSCNGSIEGLASLLMDVLTCASFVILSVMFAAIAFLSTLNSRVKPPGAAACTSSSFRSPAEANQNS